MVGHGNHGRDAGLSPGSARRPQKSLRKGRNVRRLTLSVLWWKVLGQVMLASKESKMLSCLERRCFGPITDPMDLMCQGQWVVSSVGTNFLREKSQ